MFRVLWNFSLVIPTLLSTTIALCSRGTAAEVEKTTEVTQPRARNVQVKTPTATAQIPPTEPSQGAIHPMVTLGPSELVVKETVLGSTAKVEKTTELTHSRALNVHIPTPTATAQIAQAESAQSAAHHIVPLGHSELLAKETASGSAVEVEKKTEPTQLRARDVQIKNPTAMSEIADPKPSQGSAPQQAIPDRSEQLVKKTALGNVTEVEKKTEPIKLRARDVQIKNPTAMSEIADPKPNQGSAPQQAIPDQSEQLVNKTALGNVTEVEKKTEPIEPRGLDVQLKTPAAIPAIAYSDPSQGVAPVEVTPDQPDLLVKETDDDSASEVDTDPDPMEQVTSVSQLSDVQPTDWAFQALQSLVERYGCIAGYPDGTYRGNRALTRYEFAAGLNACLNQVNKLIAANTANFVTKEDLVKLQRLQETFANEIASVRGRVDGLAARVATLESHQFSITTILTGEVETVIGGVLAGDNAITGRPAPRTITFQDRLRLELNTSFTGKDQLRIQLGAGNIEPLGGVRSGVLGTNDGKTSDNRSTAYAPNQFNLGGARYRFPLGPNTTANVFAQSDGAFALGLTVPINPFFEGSAANSISRFGRRNMVYDYGDTGAGVAVLHRFSKQLELGLAYTAINGNAPTFRNGLFSGRYVALGQIIYYGRGSNFRLGLTYTNTYSPKGGAVGSTTGQNFGPVIGSNLANSTTGTGVVANVYGIEPFYRITPKFAINGWVGYAVHRYLRRGDGEVWNWAVGLAFPDLLGKGNLGGILVGMEPKLTSLSKSVNLGEGFGQPNRDTSLHIEGFYQYRLTDQIAITPGFIWITAPDFKARNADVIIGWIRTTFRF